MLLKILILAVIAWFVLRTARNLLRAVVHDQTSHDESESGRPTVIHRRRQSEDARRKKEEQDVEDARFRDL